MAQLSDDCFAFGGPMMRLSELAALLEARVPLPSASEHVALSQACGRVLAADLMAPMALPPFDNSAVDGYAVRFQDLKADQETLLPIVGYRLAGHGPDESLASQTAARIFTGAPMPSGADTVFMQEDCREEAGYVVLPAGLKPGANRRFAGEDIDVNARALPAGRVLRPQDIALAAALGVSHVAVRPRVKVAIFSTGDEVQDGGTGRRANAIYDANRPLLRAMLELLGACVTDLGILRDEPALLAPSLKAAGETHDLVVTTGGVSTGEADYVRTAVEQVGKLVIWRIAIKPGRPVALGLLPKRDIGDQAVFAGLPGNPVAAFVTFVFVLRPLLARLAGATFTPFRSFPVVSDFEYRKKAGRREFVRVSLATSGDGRLLAQKFSRDGAGVLTSLTETEGLIELPEETLEIAPGTLVNFIPYGTLLA